MGEGRGIAVERRRRQRREEGWRKEKERGIKRNCMNPSLTDGGLVRMRSEDEDEDESSVSSMGERKRESRETGRQREREEVHQTKQEVALDLGSEFLIPGQRRRGGRSLSAERS